MIKYVNIYKSSFKPSIAFYVASFSSNNKADLEFFLIVVKWFLISANYFPNFSNKTAWYYAYCFFPI